jgi:hypothetical protein
MAMAKGQMRSNREKKKPKAAHNQKKKGAHEQQPASAFAPKPAQPGSNPYGKKG